MKGFIIGAGCVVAVIAALFLWYVGVRNGIIAKEEAVDERWAQIDSLLLSRNDKIPNLVAPAKKVMAHEKEMFKMIMDARARLAGGGLSREERMAASNDLSGVLSRLLVFRESNPEMKADKAMMALMDEIAGMENRLAFAREEYNKSVKAYNTAIRQWPGSMLGFEKKTFFAVPESVKKNVDVGKLLED